MCVVTNVELSSIIIIYLSFHPLCHIITESLVHFTHIKKSVTCTQKKCKRDVAFNIATSRERCQILSKTMVRYLGDNKCVWLPLLNCHQS